VVTAEYRSQLKAKNQLTGGRVVESVCRNHKAADHQAFINLLRYFVKRKVAYSFLEGIRK
jgi:hypothetical protein